MVQNYVYTCYIILDILDIGAYGMSMAFTSFLWAERRLFRDEIERQEAQPDPSKRRRRDDSRDLSPSQRKPQAPRQKPVDTCLLKEKSLLFIGIGIKIRLKIDSGISSNYRLYISSSSYVYICTCIHYLSR